MNPEVHRLAEECRCLLMEVRELNRGIAEAKVRETVVSPNVDKLLEEGEELIAAGRDVEGYARIDEANALLGPASKWPDNWRGITVRVMAQSNKVSKELKWWAEEFEAKTIAEKGEQAEAQRILKALQRCLYNEMEGQPLTYLVDLQILPWVPLLEEQAVPHGEEKAQAKEEPRPEEQGESQTTAEGLQEQVVAIPEDQAPDLIAKLRKQGIIDPKALVVEIDKRVTPKLSDFKLGQLLPARPGATVGYEAKRSRGRRLRGMK